MRLHEYEAKRLFQGYGIPIPRGEVARSRERVEEIARTIGKPIAIKAQVLVGGRGKAGGVGFAETPEKAGLIAEEIVRQRIRGERVEEILVEEKLSIERELYAGIAVDGEAGVPVVMVSPEGGVDVEVTARKHPERIVSRRVDIFLGLRPYEARAMVKKIGFQGDTARKVVDVILSLYRVFRAYDALIAEINPLVITKEGAVVAADAVFEIDDSGLSRHPEFGELALERVTDPLVGEGKRIGVSYVGLDGDVGVICSGAGLGMATIDLIGQLGRPANFLETGGGMSEELMAGALRLVLKKPGLRGIIINIYGGINPIHEGAKGIASVIEEDGVTIPIVAKALGNFQEETWEILEGAGVTVVKEIGTEKVVETLFEVVEKER
jgi:succinyl-CoA synthetase beta subunit